ncbi:hypothetical protein Sfulv_08000 [Streptomyces fulvorobeus]|uniref:Uncharacterized protein n=1 Tax=Streptomyces fulvorobeus TaxID=284028 RepID=A0A7J0C0F0_9ACTN|nr:hypothetical protein Sfulv_08000 [Streptomyces fulvorobeus]
MTEYGRGPGSEPWHPEDPLYGDQGWDSRQAAHGQSQYGNEQQPCPQDPYAQQPQQQPYPYPQQEQYGTPQDPYGQQPQQEQYDAGWDPGQQAAMPYGGQPQDPYGQQPAGYGEQQDYYGTPEAYPPPQPPGRREAVPEQQAREWNPDVPQEETHPFFTGTDEPVGRDARDDEEPEDDSRASRRGGRGGSERRGKGKRKSRNGCACLVVSVVLVGGLGEWRTWATPTTRSSSARRPTTRARAPARSRSRSPRGPSATRSRTS